MAVSRLSSDSLEADDSGADHDNMHPFCLKLQLLLNTSSVLALLSDGLTALEAKAKLLSYWGW